MTLLGRLLITLSIAALIAAIWLTGYVFQLGLTAVVLFVVGGAILGSSTPKPRERMIP